MQRDLRHWRSRIRPASISSHISTALLMIVATTVILNGISSPLPVVARDSTAAHKQEKHLADFQIPPDCSDNA